MNPSLIALVDRMLQAARGVWHEHRVLRDAHGAATVAPELTGRTSHTADQRSDLYALGAVFYEWAASRKPFEDKDPLRMIHQQLTHAPVPPVVLRPELPTVLSDIIMRLLEKDPGRRYQSAEGLSHDLQRVRRALLRSRTDVFPLGEHDFPSQLRAPVHPVGRHKEFDQLCAGFQAASDGKCSVVLVSGPAGVGKTALVEELRALATALSGWFVSGRSDPRGVPGLGALTEALGALGSSLLTEPHARLEQLRQGFAAALGKHAGTLGAAIPQFKLLLGDATGPVAADADMASPALQSLALRLLGVVASADRPLVMVLEDLQWAHPGVLQFIEAAMHDDSPTGVVLVGTWRSDEVNAEHCVASAVERWRSAGLPAMEINLANLGEHAVADMIADMLRLPQAESFRLAAALAGHAGGNPRDTVALINALRRDGVLSPNATGWRWNVDELERHVEGAAVMDVLRARVARLPRGLRELLESLSCLRLDVTEQEAAIATAMDPRDLQARCTRLAKERVLLQDPGPPAQLRLHEPTRRAAYSGLDGAVRLKMHLGFARNLSAAGAFRAEAASQYLLAASAVADARECGAAAALMHEVALQSVAQGDSANANQMLKAALALLDRAAAGGAGVPALRLACEIDQHLTLCRLGQLDEADEAYARIELRQPGPLIMSDSACAQVSSLHSRGRTGQAVTHGLQFLQRLGFEPPDPHVAAHSDAGLDALVCIESLQRWVREFDAAGELARAPATDPAALAAANMFVQLVPTSFYARTHVAGWLVNESVSLWERMGPNPGLAVTLCLAGQLTGPAADWRLSYQACSRLVAFCEAKEWERASLQCRQMLALGCLHWFAPLEQGLEHAIRAREGLLRLGDVQAASVSHFISAVDVFESAATLEVCAQEVQGGLDLARRGDLRQLATMLGVTRQLLRCLRGETAGPGHFEDAEFSETRYLADNASMPMAMAGYHVHRGLAAAIFGDTSALCEHARTALSLMAQQCFYPAAWAHWLVALGIAREIQEASMGGVAPNAAKLIDFDRSLGWMGMRSTDAPSNFRHLYMHLLAERAWAAGDIPLAAGYFDDAVSCARGVMRPWHRAIILERAGRFHCSRSRARYGNELLAEAHESYAAWGATAKAAQLAAETGMPVVTIGAAVRHASADSLDTLAVLRASQALSSERNPARLRERVEEVLGSVAGATKVVLALWDDDVDDWVLPAEDGHTEPVRVDAAAHRVPLSALRYAHRTDELLLLADATTDNRFSHDPYFQGMERCSTMVVPIFHKGATRAMLMLENQASRGAFSVARLDAVTMIAGQLAVSLENALLYERLERKVSDQTQQLREAHSRLLAEARRAGMAQIATNVLHNVGNVLTSVNVSAHVIETQIRQSPAGRLNKLARLLDEQADNLVTFFGPGGNGRVLPGYLRELAHALGFEREQLLIEVSRLARSIDHIKNVVAMQQSYAGSRRLLEQARISELVDDALHIQEASNVRHGVEVHRDYEDVEVATLDKTRVMQILVNLLENARQAMDDVTGERSIYVQVRADGNSIFVTVRDTGCGIRADDLPKVFTHGFTTKTEGHGFGLHSCAIAAHEMDGSLQVHSDGPGTGASFVLRLPTAPGDYRSPVLTARG
ncbi:AAA family ATPase [Caenimonas koreensis]|uniref:trifunctional serine/threonine-protein kinase/ATP-binding protein/sensor histidine kinase n=1 Tax=Caenimonas koreensis TaxID=367474 RepID=UPI003783338D